jgi:hypothetical protein
MKSVARPEFWRLFDALPTELQERARTCFDLWKTNPSHPSLRFKKVGAYWSIRIGLHYRALAVVHDDVAIWFWIGSHDEYERLLAAQR